MQGFRLAERLTHWWYRRRRPDALPWTATPRRIYILPTRQGVVFGLLLLGMLISAVNYDLSLGYLFAFLLVGMALATLLATWRNLLGVTLQALDVTPVFAGGHALFHFRLASQDGHRHLGVAVRLRNVPVGYGHVDGQGLTTITLPVPAPARGRLPLGYCEIHTEYPLGLFHAWSPLKLDNSALVWPRPQGRRALPVNTGAYNEAGGQAGPGSDDFDALRPYVPGELPSRIVWKSLARHHEPQVKGFIALQSDELWLDWQATAGLAHEARYSQLAHWVMEADRRQLQYGLRLPGQRITPASGKVQRIRCLNAMALSGMDQVPTA